MFLHRLGAQGLRGLGRQLKVSFSANGLKPGVSFPKPKNRQSRLELSMLPRHLLVAGSWAPI